MHLHLRYASFIGGPLLHLGPIARAEVANFLVPAGSLLPLVEQVRPLLIEHLSEAIAIFPESFWHANDNLSVIYSSDHSGVLGAEEDRAVPNVVVFGFAWQIGQRHVSGLPLTENMRGFDRYLRRF